MDLTSTSLWAPHFVRFFATKDAILTTHIIERSLLAFLGAIMIEDLSRYHQPIGTLLAGFSADWERYRL